MPEEKKKERQAKHAKYLKENRTPYNPEKNRQWIERKSQYLLDLIKKQ